MGRRHSPSRPAAETIWREDCLIVPWDGPKGLGLAAFGLRPCRLGAGRVLHMFDEMQDSAGAVRPAYAELKDWLGQIPPDVLDYRRREAELLFRRIGITFAVYGDPEAQQRLIPFDVIPRTIAAKEWEIVRRGLERRVRPITPITKNVNTRRKILKANTAPRIWSSRIRFSAR